MHDDFAARPLGRRAFVMMMGSAALACGGADDGPCASIPEETAGPYPGDGSNGPDVLALDGVIRSDLRESFAGAVGVAAGQTIEVRLTVTDTECQPLAGAAVYLWHCDQDGLYSMYTAAEANYLRGVGIADADGVVSFTTIFPGCYDGRWPHMHFEVYADEASIGDPLVTSQLALPAAACDAVYATEGYATSAANFASQSLASDNVFSDGTDQQLAAVTGDLASGQVVALTVAVPT